MSLSQSLVLPWLPYMTSVPTHSTWWLWGYTAVMAGLDWPAPLPPSLQRPLVSWESMRHFGIYTYIHMNMCMHCCLLAFHTSRAIQYNDSVYCLPFCPPARRWLPACLSFSLSLSLSRTEPSGAVTNLSASLVGNGEHVANVSWSPLASEFWNGIPYGYYVSIVMFTLWVTIYIYGVGYTCTSTKMVPCFYMVWWRDVSCFL